MQKWKWEFEKVSHKQTFKRFFKTFNFLNREIQVAQNSLNEIQATAGNFDQLQERKVELERNFDQLMQSNESLVMFFIYNFQR